jgi:hypothetical protein
MFNFPLGAIPFAITMHYGPMNTMSDYTRSERTIAAGLVFTY